MWRVIAVLAAALVWPAQAAASLESDYVASHVPLTGSCGNVWANATIHRGYGFEGSRGGPTPRDVWFITYAGRDGTGGFTTRAGASPGACTPSPVRGSAVVAGVHGRLRGLDRVWIFAKGKFDPAGTCAAPCTLPQFVAGFYPTGTT